MRLFSFRRSAMRLVSFASMGIARGLHRSSRTHAAHRRRREQFAAWRFGSETLEGRAMMAVDLGLATDTGSSSTDGITSDGTVNVTGFAVGNTWEYSTNSGSSWIGGANSSFSLTPGIYASGRVLVREISGSGTPIGSAAFNSIAWNIDQTAPAAPTFALADDTGSSASDGITKNGLVNVFGIETGATWEYSTNRGTSWVNGTASSFTLPAGTYAIGSIQVRQTDRAGNPTVTPSQNDQAITVDSTAPSVLSIESDVATLGVGQTAQITFTLSEPSTDFVLNDVTVTGGRLSGFSGSGTNYTATFTPTANSIAPGKISVAANRFSDAAGNQNTVSTELTPDLTIDSKAPTITITTSSNILTVGQTATITFTLSEASSDFGIGDITVTGGLLSGFAQDANDPLVYTATFTPARFATAGTVTVAAGAFTDAVGNPNAAGSLLGGLVLDTGLPFITNVSVPAGIYRQGNLLPIVLTMSEKVYVTGVPEMTLSINGNQRTARYWSGNDSDTLTFLYTVGSAGTGAANDNNDVDGMQYGPINNLSTTISVKDFYGNLLNTFLPSFQTQNAYVVTQPAAPPTFTLLDNTQTPIGPGSDPRATPVSTVVLTFDVPLPFENESGDLRAGYLSLEDLELFRDGEQVDIVAGVGVLPIRLIPDVTSNQGRQTFQVSNFSELTKDAGTYILTFADAQIGAQSTITWVMTEETPAELTVERIKLAPLPEDGADTRLTEVNSVTVKFSENVFNVDLSDFTLTRDGGADLLAGSGVVLSGSGDTYVLSGLPALTSVEGSYRLTVSETNATPIQTYAGGRLIAPKSIEWIYDREPTIDSVTPVGAAGTKKVGEIIAFDVKFNESVFVTGLPALPLLIGSDSKKSASYVSGNGTDTLRFEYTVATGDEDLDGITFNSSAISLASVEATIVDKAGSGARLQFTPPSLVGYLVDGKGPAVSSVTPPSPGVYTATGTADLDFAVTFDDVVTVTTTGGTPSLTVNIGGVARQAIYNAAASSGSKVVFRYAVTAADSASGAAASITLGTINRNGGTIRDAAGNDATLTIPAGNNSFGNIIVNRLAATVTASADKTYKLGDSIELIATFPQPVNVTGAAPTIPVTINTTTGSRTTTFTYASGSGTTALTFRVTVIANDLDTDGIEVAGLITGVINDLAGNAVGLSFTPPNTAGITVDAVAPAVSSVTPPSPGVYTATAGTRDLDITLTFNEAVTVVTSGGTPTIPLTIGGAVRQATYNAGASSGNTLVFRYTIQSATDVYANGSFSVGSTVALNGGTIKDTAGNDYALVVPAVTIAGVNINRTAITSVTASADKIYKLADVIELAASFDRVVTVTGAPTISLTVGENTRTAIYASGSGTSTLKFRYTVGTGDVDADGVDLPSSVISLPTGAAIVDASGNPASLSFTPPVTSGIKVDVVAPTVTSVTGPASGTYTTGAVLTFTAALSEAVTVTGAPTLSIAIGSATLQATYDATASTATSMVFAYTVLIGDATATGITVNSISLGAATVKDSANNDANLTFTPVSLAGIVVNRNSLSSVTASGNRTYKLGDVIELTATFSLPVAVTGVPTIALTIGPNARTASYASGSGTTTLRFRYNVAAGDLDTDGIDLPSSVIALPTGAAISDSSGNLSTAQLSFVPPNTTGITVDGVVPTLTLTPPAPGSYVENDTLSFTITASEPVNVVGTPTLGIVVGVDNRVALYNAGLSSRTSLVFEYKISSADSANGITVGSLSLGMGSITDDAGNNANTAVSASGSGIVVNRTFLQSVALTSVDNKSYRVGESIEFTATFNLPVSVTGIPTLPLTIGTATKNASYISGSGTTSLRFRYTVAANDIDTDGIEFSGTSILLTSATIANKGVAAGVTFTPPDVSGVKVDATTPTLLTVTGPTAGIYAEGTTLQFVATFNKSMRVTPGSGGSLPRIALVVGTTTKDATYIAGDETPVLVFQYKVTSGDLDTDGVVPSTVIQLNGALITDLAGNSGGLTFPTLVPTNVRVDAAPPTVARFSVPATTLNGSYKAGAIIPITATLSEDVQAGSSIEITLDTGAIVTLATTTVSKVLSGNYVVAQGENSADLTVSSFVDLNVTDIAGNPLGNTNLPTGTNNIGGLRAIVIDTTAPTAPNAPAEQGTTKLSDGFLNIAEAATSTTFRVGFGTSGAAVGDRVELLVGAAPFTTPKIVTLVASDVTNGYVDFTVSNADLGADGSKSLTARVTDLAGNGGVAGPAVTFTKDTTAPGAPAQPVEQGSTKLADGFLNLVEATSATTFRVSLGTSGAIAGDKVELLVDGAAFTTPKIVTLAAGDITRGFVDFTVSNADLGSDGSKSLTARVSDQAANPGAAGMAITFTKDTAAPTPPNAPAEQGSSKLTDGFLNIAEAATSTVFRVALGSSGAAAGDRIELLIGGSQFTTPKIATLVGTDINNGYIDFTVSNADLGADGSKSLTARVTDQAGNGGVAGPAVTFTKDTTAPGAPNTPVEQGSAKLSDGFLNIAEAATSTSFRVSLGGSGAVAGDKVELLLGGASFSSPKIVTLVSGDITSGFVDLTVSNADLGADGSKSLTARVSDQAMNPSAASAAITFTKDTSAPNAPTLVLGPGVTDPVSRTEATQGGGVVTVAGDNGAAVTVTFTRGSNSVTRNLTSTGSAQAIALSAADLTTLGDGNVSVSATQIDAAGNAQTAGAATRSFSLDSVAPTVVISSNKSALRISETATITFTLSEASTTFAVDDVVVSGGSLSGFAGTGTSYTATFTPTANSTTPGNVSVAAGRFTDLAGNDNTAGSLATPISIDTAAPTVAISSSKSSLKIGETATITFTLSEVSTNFAADDVVVSGGLLSGFSGTGSVYTATFTPTANSTTPGNVTVAAGRFTDAAGNDNTAGSLVSPISIDTIAPTIAIASSGSTLKIGEVATLALTLSEPSSNFTSSDISVTGGTITSFTGSGSSYTATFTPAAAFTGTASASVAAGRFTDAAGNDNTVSNTVSISVDTVAPTVTITSNRNALKIGDTATLTFTLSEASANFTAADVSATNGTISAFTGSGTSYSATFTPATAFTGTATVSVAAGTFTDAAGNGNVANNALTIAIDTVAPAAPTLALANDTGSSPFDGFTSAGTFNVSGVEGGATWQFSTDGVNWTSGSGNSFTLGSGSYAPNAIRVRQTDAAGNTGPAGAYAGGVTVDSAAPTIVSITSPTSGTRGTGETVVINATASEAVQAGSSVTVTLDTGNALTLVTLVAAQEGTTLTGSFVIQPGQVSTNLRAIAIGLTSGGTKDLAGNTLVSTIVPNNSLGAIDGAIKAAATGFSNDPNVVMDRRAAVRSIPITFSTPVTGFTLATLRLTVNGRSVSLRGATLRGSGASYTLLLPARATNLNGIYTLQIGGQGPTIQAIANGAELTTPSSIYWGKGRSIGIAPTVKAATFAAAAKPAPKPRAAAFRTMR